MKFLQSFNKSTNIVTRIGGYIGTCALVFNVVIVLANTILRAAGSSIVGTEEFIAMGEVVLIFMALGYTQYTHGLVHVCFFMKKLPKLGPVIAWMLEQWVSIVVAALWLYQTVKRIPMVNQVTTSRLIPHKPFYVVIAIGVAMYMLALIYEAVKSTIALKNEKVREDLVESWPA